MTQSLPFQQLLPGLSQLQALMQGAFKAQQGAGHAAPLGGWMQPALTPEQIESRIAELRTVLYWLEQNVHAVKATIEAMEVQRLTLSALSAMNVNMTELAKSFRLPDLGSWPSWTQAAAEAGPGAAAAAPSQPEPASPVESPAASPSGMDHAAFNPAVWLQPLSQAFAWPGAAAKPDAGQAPAEPSARPESVDPVSIPPAEAAAAESAAAVPEQPEHTGAAANGPEAAVSHDPFGWWGTVTRQFQALASSALQQPVAAEAMLEAGQRAQQAMASGAQDMAKLIQSAAKSSVQKVDKADKADKADAAGTGKASQHIVAKAPARPKPATPATAKRVVAHKPAAGSAPVRAPLAKGKPAGAAVPVKVTKTSGPIAAAPVASKAGASKTSLGKTGSKPASAAAAKRQAPVRNSTAAAKSPKRKA